MFFFSLTKVTPCVKQSVKSAHHSSFKFLFTLKEATQRYPGVRIPGPLAVGTDATESSKAGSYLDPGTKPGRTVTCGKVSGTIGSESY
eukprot:3345718-Rhodomonas_salina.1